MRDATSLRQVLSAAIKKLQHAGCETPRLDAEVLLMEVLSWNRADLISRNNDALKEADVSALSDLVDRRSAREPIAHILGRKEFWSLDFKVSANTLVPRPDSEAVVEAALRRMGDRREEPIRILDLGTGSGCLLIALMSEFKNAEGVGVDQSSEALEVAEMNANLLGPERTIRFLRGDWFDALPGDEAAVAFDLIVSNPPYIASAEIAGLMPEVTNFEPVLALDGGTDGLNAYRQIIGQASRHMKPGACLLLEVGAGQAPDVGLLMQAESLTDIEFQRDLAGIDRCVIATLRALNP